MARTGTVERRGDRWYAKLSLGGGRRKKIALPPGLDESEARRLAAGYAKEAEPGQMKKRPHGTGSICEFEDERGRQRLKIAVTVDGKQLWRRLPHEATRQDAAIQLAGWLGEEMARKRVGSLELRKGVWHARLTITNPDGSTSRPWFALRAANRTEAELELGQLIESTPAVHAPTVQPERRLDDKTVSEVLCAAERIGSTSDDIVELQALLTESGVSEALAVKALVKLVRDGKLAVYVDATAGVCGKEMNREEPPPAPRPLRERRIEKALNAVRKVNEERLKAARSG